MQAIVTNHSSGSKQAQTLFKTEPDAKKARRNAPGVYKIVWVVRLTYQL